MVDLKSKDKVVHKIEGNNLNVKRIKSGLISLNNSNMNEFSITKYKNNFSKNQKTARFVGDARDFIIDGDKVYVLANVYGETTRDVTIYTIDLKTLAVIKTKKIKDLAYGFHFKKINNDLNIYGNLTEEKEELSVFSYSLANSTVRETLSSSVPVMWVNKTKRVTPEKELVLNAYSLVEIDYKNKKAKVSYRSKNSLIDFRYDSLEKCYYILEGDFDKKTFEVTKLNLSMKKLKSYKVKPDRDTIPVRILI